jgi:hypothetical protein
LSRVLQVVHTRIQTIVRVPSATYPQSAPPALSRALTLNVRVGPLIKSINDTSRLQREAIQDLQRIQAERPQPQPQPKTTAHTPQPIETESKTESPASRIGSVPQNPVPEPLLLPFSPQDSDSGIPSAQPACYAENSL